MNSEIEIFWTIIVKRYRITAFITKENNPKVIMFNGRVMRLKIGLTRRNKSDKTIPPIMYIDNPPSTLTPSKTCETIKSATV